jgi:hypothetical protein
MPKGEKMTMLKMNGSTLQLEGIIGNDRRINIPKRAKQVPLDKKVRITIDWENY